MSAIEMTGTIDEHSQLKLDASLPISGPKRVRVLILSDWDDIDNEESWLKYASQNPSFQFLSEPEEDIYSVNDGELFQYFAYKGC
jgi:hypothetical protein